MKAREITRVGEIEVDLGGANTLVATHRDLVVDALLEDPSFNTGRKAMRAAERIEEAFSGDDDPIRLTEEDWSMLQKVAESPAKGYSWKPGVMRKLAPMLDAVIDAESVEVK